MKITGINNANKFTASFGKALHIGQKEDFQETLENVRAELGILGGTSILRISSAAMPSRADENTGVGKYHSPAAYNALKTLCLYTGANAVLDYPAGQKAKHYDHFYSPYSATGTTFGEQNINLFDIAYGNTSSNPVYGKILPKNEIKYLVNKNKADEHYINFENEIGTDYFYPVLKPLRLAYDNFKKGLAPKKLTHEFEEYKQRPNVKDKYDRLALYPFIGEKEPDLFVNFDKNPSTLTNNEKKDLEKRKEKYDNYLKIYKDEIEFFKFRQFLAVKQLKEAKEKINALGTKLMGDCPIGFAPSEEWAFFDAFNQKETMGWSLPALDYDSILHEGSPSHELFNDKISLYIENYDGVRFDVGNTYYNAKTINIDDGRSIKHPFGRKVYDFIEKRAKEIKGENFDTRKLIYEMDGCGDDFVWNDKSVEPTPDMRNIVRAYKTENEHIRGLGWGNPDFYKKAGLRQDEYTVGMNHDARNLKQNSMPQDFSKARNEEELNVMKDIEKKRLDSAKALSKSLCIPQNVLLKNPKEFVSAKFAELYKAKNQFFFFPDVMGLDTVENDYTPNPEDFRIRLSSDFEREFHKALQNGEGFNIMESLLKVMKAKSIDEINPFLYSKVRYYANYLRAPGALTEEEANKEVAFRP